MYPLSHLCNRINPMAFGSKVIFYNSGVVQFYLPASVPKSSVLSIGISMPCIIGMLDLQVAHNSCSGPRKCSGKTRKLRASDELSKPLLSVLGRYEVTIHLSTCFNQLGYWTMNKSFLIQHKVKTSIFDLSTSVTISIRRKNLQFV